MGDLNQIERPTDPMTDLSPLQSALRRAVEIEIAAAVLERVIGWAKIFAWCVAIPAAVLVAIFAVAGIGKFADFISRVHESEKRVGEYVATSEKQISDLVGRATETATKYQAQLDAIERQQTSLQETVNELERLVGAPGSKVSSAVLSKLQTAFRPFQSYLSLT
jgi:predicted PurR-regulated permease PerM